MAALCVSPQRDQVRLYFRLYPGGNIDSPRVIAFLKDLDRELETNWCLLWDRLNAHRAKTTTTWLATTPQLRSFFFPSYAPELNPVEYLWSWSKMNPLANRAIHEVDQLAAVARNSTRSLQQREDLLRSFIQHSPLFLRLE